MNYSILLVVEKPDLMIPATERKWNDWKDEIKNISKRCKNLTVLGENVLLLSIQNSLTALKESLNHLDSMNYKYAIFDTEIQWHEEIKDF